MNFNTKNFSYVTKKFGDFVDEIEAGGKLYLRSLSSVKPSEVAADISEDFPSIAADFRLPPELSVIMDNAHSSPLRISGPVTMWLHYDVMANVLCKLRFLTPVSIGDPSGVEASKSLDWDHLFRLWSVENANPSAAKNSRRTTSVREILFALMAQEFHTLSEIRFGLECLQCLQLFGTPRQKDSNSKSAEARTCSPTSIKSLFLSFFLLIVAYGLCPALLLQDMQSH